MKKFGCFASCITCMHSRTQACVCVWRRSGESHITTKYCRWEHMWEDHGISPKSLCRIHAIFGASEDRCQSSQVSKYCVYIQWTSDKKPFQIISKCLFYPAWTDPRLAFTLSALSWCCQMLLFTETDNKLTEILSRDCFNFVWLSRVASRLSGTSDPFDT